MTNVINTSYNGVQIILNGVSLHSIEDPDYLKSQVDQVLNLLKTKGENLFGKGVTPNITYIETGENTEYDSNNLPTEGYNTLTLVISRPLPQVYKDYHESMGHYNFLEQFDKVSELEKELAQFESKETEQAMELAQQVCNLYEDCYYSSDTRVTVTPQVITMVFSGDIPY